MARNGGGITGFPASAGGGGYELTSSLSSTSACGASFHQDDHLRPVQLATPLPLQVTASLYSQDLPSSPTAQSGFVWLEINAKNGSERVSPMLKRTSCLLCGGVKSWDPAIGLQHIARYSVAELMASHTLRHPNGHGLVRC